MSGSGFLGLLRFEGLEFGVGLSRVYGFGFEVVRV